MNFFSPTPALETKLRKNNFCNYTARAADHHKATTTSISRELIQRYKKVINKASTRLRLRLRATKATRGSQRRKHQRNESYIARSRRAKRNGRSEKRAAAVPCVGVRPAAHVDCPARARSNNLITARTHRTICIAATHDKLNLPRY